MSTHNNPCKKSSRTQASGLVARIRKRILQLRFMLIKYERVSYLLF
jgi:hypothetical protein